MTQKAGFLEQVKRFVPGPARELFFLERAEEAARRLTPEQQITSERLFSAAERRMRAAELLSSDDDTAPVAFLVAGEGVRLMTAAVLAAHTEGSELSVLDYGTLASQVRTLAKEGRLPALPPELDPVCTALAERDPLTPDNLDPSLLVTQRAALERCAQWMRAQIEVRTVRAIRSQRRIRLGVLAAALLLLVVAGVNRLFSTRNIALHKPVTMSSVEPNQPPGTGPSGAPPGNLVDGSTSAPFDIVTRWETRSWVQVDLQATHKIKRLAVYFRSDCCWETALPAVIEVSLDGQTYQEVARRAEPFAHTDPWNIDLANVSARYVRMRKDSNELGNIVMRELEVYGR